MAFSFNSYTGDGSTTEFAITFDYLTETVVVSSDPKGIEVHVNGVKQTSGYTINTSTNKVNFTTAPVNAAGVSVLRVTPRGKGDRLVDFADGTIITEAQLDTVSLQILYIAQEAFEQSSSGGSATPTYLSYDEASGYWDALYSASTQTIRNLKLPTTDDSAASKLYVDNVATWGIGAVPQQWTFSGTGAQDTFTLTGGPNLEEEMLVVSIDGALQIPNTDFSVEQADPDSTLDFDVAPDNGTVISVQNFGKMRFLDGVNISDGSITTAKLDQTATTEAVSTATIRDDAVTAAKIADSAVDFARVNTTTFTTSTGDTSPRFLSVPVSGTGLSLGTLSTASIVDFNTNVDAKKLNDFQAPDGTVSMGTQKINNLVDPTASHEAATKGYVDTEISSVSASDIVKLGSYSLSSKANNFEISGWYDSQYDSYDFECYNFSSDDDSGGTPNLMQFADSAGTYQTALTDVDAYWTVTALQTASQTEGGTATNATMGMAVPQTDDGTSEIFKHNFRLWLPNNRPGFTDNKMVISEGYGQVMDVSLGGGVSGLSTYRCCNMYMADTGVITKIKFRATDQITDTGGWSGDIAAGARVIVYGRKFN